LPTTEKPTDFEKAIAYSLTAESTPTSFTLRRTYALGNIIFLPDKYPSLRSFYSKMESNDQGSVVLTSAPATAKAATPAAN
ncbi:MAG: transglutaminase, partial [Edaphobacter sp.]